MFTSLEMDQAQLLLCLVQERPQLMARRSLGKCSRTVHRNFYVEDRLASRPTTKEAIDLVTATTDYVEFMGKIIEKGYASPVPIEEITKPQSGRVW